LNILNLPYYDTIEANEKLPIFMYTARQGNSRILGGQSLIGFAVFGGQYVFSLRGYPGSQMKIRDFHLRPVYYRIRLNKI